MLIPRDLIPPTSTVISGAVNPRSCALSSIISSGAVFTPSAWKFLNASDLGSKTSKDSISVWSWVASPLPGVKGTSTPEAISIATLPARIIISATDAPVSLEIDS